MPKIKVSDVSLSYEEMGEGPPVVLVTGIGADSLAWAMNAPVLMGNHRVITVDNRDVGLSDRASGPYTMAQMGDDVIGFLKELNPGPVHLVGQSMGGMICQHVALKAPELLRSLTLVTSIARVPPASKLLLDLWTNIIEKLGMEGFADFVMIMTISSEYIENNLEGLQAFKDMMLMHLAQNPVEADAFRRQGEAVLGHDVLDRLGEISTPTLVMAGGEDILVPKRFSDAIAAAIPGAEYVVLESCGHGMNVEDPGRFNETLLAWFQKWGQA